MDSLSNSNPHTWDYYEELPVKKFLNILSYYKVKQQEEKNKAELQRLKNGR